MAASDSHPRSNSLPSKPHPLILQCNEHLSRLEASTATTSSSSSLSSSFGHKLSDLEDLHETVEKLVQLSLTREVLVQESQENWVEKLLDGSLRLLDACTAAKDALLHTKECAREVQSIMRRKRGGEMEVTVEVRKYLTSRKVVKKAISKALENLKTSSNKCKLSPCHKAHPELVSLFKDVEIVTLQILESLLSFIIASTKSKLSNWSLVSKLMHNRKVSYTQEAEENEFAKVDSALQAFVFHTTGKSENTDHLQNQLENLESVIQDFVERLETLFRRLIKTRVALLNILNH
ncbi:uncharacterized protein LOC129292211 [Prosopis cineraria]|uniref:uncharacterized protein LOC129292211 n=1 Tax=Prosopis cineraria TaxID=364024 RepID=UPI00240F2B53|nr:uncharacterized protein LOC129292211 [Prosopis cineraria]